MTSVVCENLVKIYPQHGVEVVALQGLDLSVAEGEMIGIVGESGSGKTTLLNLLGGLDRPSAGQAIVDGLDLLKLPEADLDQYRCQKVGFVWQQVGRNLIPYLTAAENVELPMRLTVTTSNERRDRAIDLLAAVGLTDRAQSLPEQLSGGQQQRVAVAVALANRPGLLLADEPTGELDTATAREIYGLLRKVNRELGTTILIVSHDPSIADQVDRVVAICDGKTSVETVRVQFLNTLEKPDETRSPEPDAFEELLMLDSAGRVQIPSEVLEFLGIGRRVRLEVKEDGLVLRAVDGHRRSAPAPRDGREASDQVVLFEEEAIAEPAGVHWLVRVYERFAGWIRRERR